MFSLDLDQKTLLYKHDLHWNREQTRTDEEDDEISEFGTYMG